MTDLEIFANYIKVISKYPHASMNSDGTLNCGGIVCTECPSENTCTHMSNTGDFRTNEIKHLNKKYHDYNKFLEEFPEYFI